MNQQVPERTEEKYRENEEELPSRKSVPENIRGNKSNKIRLREPVKECSGKKGAARGRMKETLKIMKEAELGVSIVDQDPDEMGSLYPDPEEQKLPTKI
jgi:hypothetical protein